MTHCLTMHMLYTNFTCDFGTLSAKISKNVVVRTQTLNSLVVLFYIQMGLSTFIMPFYFLGCLVEHWQRHNLYGFAMLSLQIAKYLVVRCWQR